MEKNGTKDNLVHIKNYAAVNKKLFAVHKTCGLKITDATTSNFVRQLKLHKEHEVEAHINIVSKLMLG